MERMTMPVSDPSDPLPSWKILDVEALHEEFPETFGILPLEQRRALQVGDVVKLIFELCKPPEDGPGGERMWVKITEVREGREYRGTLQNTPVVIKDLAPGQVIPFSPGHVADIEALLP